MYTLSNKSKERLITCDERLQKIVNQLLLTRQVVVLCGFRGEQEQNEAFSKGNSKLKFPESKHNSFPSLAVDLAPSSPVDWNDLEAFKKLGEDFKKVATDLGISIRWGGDFKSLKDYPHFELI